MLFMYLCVAALPSSILLQHLHTCAFAFTIVRSLFVLRSPRALTPHVQSHLSRVCFECMRAAHNTVMSPCTKTRAVSAVVVATLLAASHPCAVGASCAFNCSASSGCSGKAPTVTAHAFYVSDDPFAFFRTFPVHLCVFLSSGFILRCRRS